ncbi:MAG: hypothetical protein N3G19_02960 [Candidatus Pacearchaeota archaeon]|nr:hypothetical protein [Candidatus Pacearchaeota archaeon]
MNKKSKKGQVTLFIIIAILIVAVAVAGYFIYQNYQKVRQERFAAEVAPIKAYVEDCLMKTGKDALILVGMQGGFIEPKLKVEAGEWNISYWIYNGQDKTPSLETISNEISKHIETFLPFCTMAFYGFQNTYIIDEGTVKATTTFRPGEVKITVKWPLIIARKMNNEKVRIEDFSVKLLVNLLDIYNLASKIVENEKSSQYLDLEMLANSNFDIAIMPYDNKTLIYAISDNKSIIYNAPYTFMFATKSK